MKKFILGIILGVLIAGTAFMLSKQDNAGGQNSANSAEALNKIRQKQIKQNNQAKPNKQTDYEENLRKAVLNLMQAKEPKDMLAAVNEILKYRPQDANIHALKAQILQKQGNLKEALDSINKAIFYDSQNANLYQLRAEINFARKDYAAAERDFSIAAQLSGKADNYYNRAVTNLNLGDYQAANRDFRKAQELYKKEDNLLASVQAKNISNMLSKNMPKETPKATKGKGVKGSPSKQNTGSTTNNAILDKNITSKISQSLKHFSEDETFKEFKDLLPKADYAAPDFEEIAKKVNAAAPKVTKKELLKDTALESMEKAKKLVSQKDFAGAKSVLDSAINSYPENDALYYNRAQANYMQGDYKSAFADLNKAIELNPKNYDAIASKGDLFNSFGDSEQAKAAYKEAEKLAKQAGNKKAAEQAKAKYQLIEGKEITAKANQRFAEAANAYTKGDFDKASALFKQIYDEDPNDAYNAFNLALAYQGQGKLEEANKMFIKAADQRPTDLNLQMPVVQLGLQRNDLETAQKYLDRAMNIDNTNPDVWALSANYYSTPQISNIEKTKESLHNSLNGYQQQLQKNRDPQIRKETEEKMQNISDYLERLENFEQTGQMEQPEQSEQTEQTEN